MEQCQICINKKKTLNMIMYVLFFKYIFSGGVPKRVLQNYIICGILCSLKKKCHFLLEKKNIN